MFSSSYKIYIFITYYSLGTITFKYWDIIWFRDEKLSINRYVADLYQFH